MLLLSLEFRGTVIYMGDAEQEERMGTNLKCGETREMNEDNESQRGQNQKGKVGRKSFTEAGRLEYTFTASTVSRSK